MEEQVYVGGRYGRRYHRARCPLLSRDERREIPRSQAEEEGFDPCAYCFRFPVACLAFHCEENDGRGCCQLQTAPRPGLTVLGCGKFRLRRPRGGERRFA